MKKLLLLLLFFPIISISQDLPTYYAYSGWQLSKFKECYYKLKCFNASSTLSSQGNSNYRVENMGDLDTSTAWVEGSVGYGIGESFMVKLRSYERFIQIFNGYQKSKKLWEQNSRVKTFKVYIVANGDHLLPLCFLVLENKMGSQSFRIFDAIREWEKETIPHVDPGVVGLESNEYGRIAEDLTLMFEIYEVYKGERWSDVAISGVSEWDDGNGCLGNGR